ncbi:uncharacterized protein LOC101849219 [Aplysia californica]|uniref:Vacuolar ATPase assembly protein VMA22 n=1 Tax=Aplysia californica TaxID=6500 RepID=A0ABM0JTK6_APLCA|nr:uncharacterized protein LOC101849219 [Aplysia californica]
MEEICEQLDKTCLQIFDVLESLYEAQGKLEQVMKDGFLGISRARYSLGMSRVSSDQFVDADLVATRTVIVKDESGGRATKSLAHSDCGGEISKPTFKLQVNAVRIKSKSDDSDSEEISSQPKEADQSEGLLRQRKREKSDQENESKNDSAQAKINPHSGASTSIADKGTDSKKFDSETQDNGSSKKNEKLFNPVNLFGVLVPQHLRMSQKNFEEAVSLTVTIAGLKSELECLRSSYDSFREKKKSMVSEAVNPEA